MFRHNGIRIARNSIPYILQVEFSLEFSNDLNIYIVALCLRIITSHILISEMQL